MKARRRPPEGVTPPGLLRWKGLRWSAAEREEGFVVVEAPLEVAVEGHLVAVLMYTPGLERELALGYCLGEGILSPEDEIEALDVGEGQETPTRVTIRLRSPTLLDLERLAQPRLVLSGCAANAPGNWGCTLPPLGAGITLSAGVLQGSVKSLASAQNAYRAAGGIHAAGVFSVDGNAVVVCEDIGRHNAADKAFGYCVLRDIPLNDKFLLATGRASYEVVTKSVRLGVSIVASMSSPTSLSVQLAEVLNQTLIGYLRPRTFVVYAHPWRLHDGEPEV